MLICRRGSTPCVHATASWELSEKKIVRSHSRHSSRRRISTADGTSPPPYSLERLNLRRAPVNMTGDGHYPLPVPCGARRGALEGETARGAARCATSTARPGAKPSSASAPVHARSLALGLAVSSLDGLAASAGHRGAGDRYRVAPPRPPPVGLELPILGLNRELDNVAWRPTSDLR